MSETKLKQHAKEIAKLRRVLRKRAIELEDSKDESDPLSRCSIPKLQRWNQRNLYDQKARQDKLAI